MEIDVETVVGEMAVAEAVGWGIAVVEAVVAVVVVSVSAVPISEVGRF